MRSSDVRFSGQRSNFSNTCNRLSQYLKQNGSFGDLSLGLSHNSAPSGNSRPTMDLLPMIEKSGQKSGHGSMNLFPSKKEAVKKIETRAAPEKAQMTIFYDGKVIVFDDFPADKAKELMLFASSKNGGGTTSNTNSFPTTAAAAAATTTLVAPMMSESPAGVVSIEEMPIARKASLTRFLEKRKDRIVSRGPYQMSSPKGGDSSSSKGWLGLSANFPVKILY